MPIRRRHLEFYTDGAYSSKTQMGGWATVCLEDGDLIDEQSGYEPYSTNNRMELTAVIEGLKALKVPCRVTVVTDSQYVANGINLGWAEGWKANNWRKKDKKPALNPELWDALLNEIARHEVTIQWIKGHAGHPENERCDEMAVAESQKFM